MHDTVTVFPSPFLTRFQPRGGKFAAVFGTFLRLCLLSSVLVREQLRKKFRGNLNSLPFIFENCAPLRRFLFISFPSTANGVQTRSSIFLNRT